MIQKLVRVVDVLAERLIFDVILGTSRRRRAVAGMALGCVAGAYLASGLLMSPGTLAEANVISCQPYFDDTAVSFGNWDAVELLLDKPASPAVVKTVREQIAARQADLDGIQRKVLAPRAPSFDHEVSYRKIRELAYGYSARGMLRADEGRGDAAVRDWITVARLGRVVARGPADRAVTLVDGMIGCAVQNGGTKQLTRHLAAGRMTREQAVAVLDDLERWRTEGYTLESLLRGERVSVSNLLDRIVIEGKYPRGLGQLDAITPTGRQDRVAFLAEVRANVLAHYDRVLAGVHGDEQPPAPAHQHCACWTADDAVLAPMVHVAPALVLRGSAISHASAALIDWCVPNFKAAGKRLQERAQQRAELAAGCRNLLAR